MAGARLGRASRDMLSILCARESKGACAALQRAQGRAAAGLWGCSGRAGADFASVTPVWGAGVGGGHDTMTTCGCDSPVCTGVSVGPPPAGGVMVTQIAEFCPAS